MRGKRRAEIWARLQLPSTWRQTGHAVCGLFRGTSCLRREDTGLPDQSQLVLILAHSSESGPEAPDFDERSLHMTFVPAFKRSTILRWFDELVETRCAENVGPTFGCAFNCLRPGAKLDTLCAFVPGNIMFAPRGHGAARSVATLAHCSFWHLLRIGSGSSGL